MVVEMIDNGCRVFGDTVSTWSVDLQGLEWNGMEMESSID